MRRAGLIVLALAVLAGAARGGGVPSPPRTAGAEEDLAAARRLFETNLDAIRRRDAETYRACYLDSPDLVRSGPTGPSLGMEKFVVPADNDWPESLDAYDLRVVPVRAGVVYGSYRYRVVFSGRPVEGLSERLFVKTERGWRIAVSTAFPAPPGTPPPPLALIGATLIDGTGAPPLPDSVVLLRDGKIECSGTASACPIPEGVTRKDVKQRWLVPGLVDAHVHFSQTGWVDGRPDAIDLRDQYAYERSMAWLRDHVDVLFRTYLYNGVTAVFDVGGYPWTWILKSRAEDDPLAPHVAAAGPLLTTWLPEILTLPEQSQFNLMGDDDSIERAVSSHAAFGADAIKIWFIVDPTADRLALAARVRKAGEASRAAGLPLIVHATGLAEAKDALRAGARLLVHGVSDAPVDQEFLDLAHRNDAICTPTLTVLDGYRQVYERHWDSSGVPLEGVDPETLARAQATDSIPADRVAAGRLSRFRERMAATAQHAAENVRRMRDAGMRLAVGTDAGNPLTLHGASIFREIEAMSASGLTPMQVLRAATARGAEAMGRTDIGVVQAGKIADLLVLGADPLSDPAHLRDIEAVIRRGTWHRRAELRPLALGEGGGGR